MSFGTDLLILGGEIMWNGDDLATVSGVDNVNQQAYLLCITDRGESVFFTEYGALLQKWADKPYTPENKVKAEAEARAALLRVGDNWIEEVTDCQFQLATVEGQQVKQLYAKYLIRGETETRELRFNVGGGNNV